MSVWTIHLKPEPDELLSSWLIRIAASQGRKIHSFSVAVWGPAKDIWNRDIDHMANDEFLAPLVGGTGVTLQRARATTLRDLIGVVFERVVLCGKTPLILPLGILNRFRSNHGMQFCPACLATDTYPYFRRRWRLAAWVVCLRHRRLLHDRCQRCGSPVNFHRGEMGNRRKILSRPPVFCTICGCDYRKARPLDLSEEAIRGLIAWQRRFDDAIESGILRLSRRVVLTPLAFFQGLRVLLSVICRCNAAFDLRWLLAERGPFQDKIPLQGRAKEFEHMDVLERTKALFWAEMLLEDWPSRFVNWSLATGTSSVEFTKAKPPMPFWLGSTISEHLFILHSPRPGGLPPANTYVLANLRAIRQRRNQRRQKAGNAGRARSIPAGFHKS